MALVVFVPLPIAENPAAALAMTNAFVAQLVSFSPTVPVVHLVPGGSVGVPERFAAVPVVLWLNIGKLVKLAALKTGDCENPGAAEPFVKLPKTELAACVESVNAI